MKISPLAGKPALPSMLAANGVEVMIAPGDEYTPTPVVLHASLTYSRGRETGLADGIVITPSRNPLHNGGFNYDAPNGWDRQARIRIAGPRARNWLRSG